MSDDKWEKIGYPGNLYSSPKICVVLGDELRDQLNELCIVLKGRRSDVIRHLIEKEFNALCRKQDGEE